MSANTQFPTAPAFADSFLPAPPVFEEENMEVGEYVKKLSGFLTGQYTSLVKMQNSIASGWLVSSLRVLDLTADTITADSVFTQDLWIGSDDSTPGYIGLLGTSTQIKIVDEAGTVRVLMGDLGSGTTNWGAQFSDTSGTVIMEVADQVFISGAIITDATITNAKILNSTIDGSTKLANSSVPNSKIGSDLNAGKLSTGTLTVNASSGVAIDVTGGGAVLLRNGADIIFRAASSGNTSYLKFHNSAGTSQGDLSWDVSTDLLRLRSLSGDMQVLATTGDLQLYSSGGNIDIQATGGRVDITSSAGAALHLDSSGNVALDAAGSVITFNNLFRPTAHNSFDIGLTGTRVRRIYTVNISSSGGFTTGDVQFGNGEGIIITEPDRVWLWGKKTDGIVFMSPKWKPLAWLKPNGNLHISGKVREHIKFDTPDLDRPENIDEEQIAA